VALAEAHRDAAVEHLHQRHGVDLAAVDAAHRDRPAAPHGLDRGGQRVQPVDREAVDDGLGHGVGQQPGGRDRLLGDRVAVRLHAHGVDGAVGPTSAGEVEDRRGDVVDLVDVDDLEAPRAGQLEPLGHPVDADDTDTSLLGDARGHLADRPQAEYCEGLTLGDVGVGEGLPRCRDDVRDVEVPLVRDALGHLDRPELRLRHPQVLGLAARHRSVHVGVAEQRRTFAVLGVLRGLALREQAARAHPAVTARDVERHHDAVADLQVARLGADLLDDAHGLVAQHVAGVQVRAEDLVEVQVGPADRGRGDLDDRVGGLLDAGVGDVLDRDLLGALPGQCLHTVLLVVVGRFSAM
jgi:hypothetical protein